ncbi:MAG: hypothetical protein Q9188_006216 [Gyalolechia gomerana]
MTETVTKTANPSSIASSPGRLSDGGIAVDTYNAITTTLSSTDFLTDTKTVSVDGTPVPLPSHDGSFSFVENNGETTWLGDKTPTSGAALVTNTLVVTVKPQPVTETFATAATSTSEDATTTSVTTISSTSFYTHYLTKALTLQTASTAGPSSKLPPYLESYGWNATLSRVHRPKSEAPNIDSTGAYAVDHSTWLKRHHPRQIGVVVTATINGVVVAWTNNYGGEPQTSSSVTSIETSSANQAATSTSDIYNQHSSGELG